ncbi:MAG: hypothetical protein II318_07045 [Bacteroidales bacterium]|nr:hypothetical protein [Bacteroidales bacterium]
MLSSDKGKKITTKEIYSRLEETLAIVDKNENGIYSNEFEDNKYKNRYKQIVVDAVVRLLKILMDIGKVKYLIVSDYPQEEIKDRLVDEILTGSYDIDNASFQYFNTHEESKAPFSVFKDENGNPIDKIYTIECALIIDELLSYGVPITTQDIYNELDLIFNLTSRHVNKIGTPYSVQCKDVYGVVYKEAMRRLSRELEIKGKSDILFTTRFGGDKRKRVYQYKEPNFSAFKPLVPTMSSEDVKLKALVRRIYLLNNTKCTLDNLQDLLKCVHMSVLSKTGSIENDFKIYLSEIQSFVVNKPNGWLVECYERFKFLLNECCRYISDNDYASLLVFYADFVYEYGLSKEFKSSCNLENGWFNTIIDSLEKAVNITSQFENVELYISYVLKYINFIIEYGSAELYNKLDNLYQAIFSKLNNRTQIDSVLWKIRVLRSRAMLSYVRKNVDLSIKNLEHAKDICYANIFGDKEHSITNIDYLTEYILLSKDLADIFFDHTIDEKENIERSVNEYKDLLDKSNYLTNLSPKFRLDFIYPSYKRLAILYHKMNKYREEEKMYEKCVIFSLVNAKQDSNQVYLRNFEQDIISWATSLREVFGTTLIDSYMQALNQYMQIEVGLGPTTIIDLEKVVPKSLLSSLVLEVNLFQRIQERRNNIDLIEDKISLAKLLEELGDLHSKICYDVYELIEKEYSEAFFLYQTLNDNRRHTYAMINLLGKLSKNYVYQNKIVEADRMYHKLYHNLFLLYGYTIFEDDEIESHGIDIAKIMVDYALFLEGNNKVAQAASVYENILYFCDKIIAHEQSVLSMLMSNRSCAAVILPAKGIKCDVLHRVAKMYEHNNQIDQSIIAYKNSIEFCLREEKDNPGAYVVYIILQLEEFAEMIRCYMSFKEADSMLAPYLKIIYSSSEDYGDLIAKMPELNWIKKAKLSVDHMRNIVKDKNSVEWDSLLIEELRKLAEVQCVYGEYNDAKDSCIEIIDLFLKIEKDRPGLYTEETADSYSLLASVYKELNLKIKAIQSYENAIILYKRLATHNSAMNPCIAQCLRALAELYES